MKVANIIEEGRWGGPQKRITMIAKELKDYDIQTIVLLPSNDSEIFRSALNRASITWKALPLHRLERDWRSLIIYALTFFVDIYHVWRVLRNEKFDLLHVSGGSWQIKGPIAGRLAGIPVIWHLNDTQVPKLLELLFYLLSPLAKAFIVTSDRVRNYYLTGKYFRDKPIFSLQAPVDVYLYDRERARKSSLISAYQGIRIVAVANVSPIKGFETLIEAIALSKKQFAELHLFIVGAFHRSQTKYVEWLHKLSESLNVKSDITFLGYQDEIPEILAACDIFVCSSVSESGPMSVWEAMAMGCAIISTDVGDVATYINNGENGFIVPVGNAQAMSSAICRLSKDRELREIFGKKARQIACCELDVRVIAKKTSEAYLYALS